MIPDLSFAIGKITITPFHWSLVLAFLFFSFNLWQKMKEEDYSEDEIFGLTIILVISALIFARFFSIYLHVSLWGAFWGTVLISVWRFRLWNKNIWEGLDCLSKPFFYFFLFGGFGLFLTNFQWFSLGYILVGLTGFFLYGYLKRKYRRLSWYKSGKTGFLFWAMSFYLSLTLLVLDFIQNNGLYLSKALWLASIAVSAYVIWHRAEISKSK